MSSEEDDDGEDGQPLSDLAAEVEARAAADEDEKDVFEEAFEEVDAENLDAETVWADLLADDGPAAINPPEAEDDADRDVRVISKRTCHDCRFFSKPPSVHCNHDGTTIREAVDMERYEVVDCPMVVDSEDVGLE